MPTLRVWDGAAWHTMAVPRGANLRAVLLERGLSPYTALTGRMNCGGRGLCATCGVRLDPPAPEPSHWHDGLAARFGYPRLSCQITIDHDLQVRLLPDKRIWGSRER